MSDALFTVLQRIEVVSSTAEIRVRWIADDVNELVNLPAWETKAEDELERLERRCARTLQTVQQARQLLLKKRPLQAAE